MTTAKNRAEQLSYQAAWDAHDELKELIKNFDKYGLTPSTARQLIEVGKKIQEGIPAEVALKLFTQTGFHNHIKNLTTIATNSDASGKKSSDVPMLKQFLEHMHKELAEELKCIPREEQQTFALHH